jgi:hypothetical protein
MLHGLWCITFLASSFAFVEPITIGREPQLFVDDYLIAEQSGLNRVVQQPERISDRPIVAADRPWEGSLVQMPIVLWDPAEERFRMYYWSHLGEVIYSCYATSRDGISWEKPVLNLHEGPDGSTANNIVLRGDGKVARIRYVVPNPDPSDPRRRFLALYIDNVPHLTEFAASSPDGLHWTTEKRIGDLRKVTEGDITSNPSFFLIEQNWVTDTKDGHRSRGIWRTESRNLHEWTGGRMVVERLPDDDPHLEFYHATSHFLGSQTYRGLHLGYLHQFHSDPAGKVIAAGTRLTGTVDTALMASRDTIHWTRVDRKRPLLPLGPKGSWEGGSNYGSPEVIAGDKLHFYYSGWKYEHGAEDNESGIGLATLPLDRVVAIQPSTTNVSGTLVTKPLRLGSERLVLNADASSGQIRVGLLDEDGHSIEGYQAVNCDPITVDAASAEITWPGRSLKFLRGRTVCLKFELRNAKLFALSAR